MIDFTKSSTGWHVVFDCPCCDRTISRDVQVIGKGEACPHCDMLLVVPGHAEWREHRALWRREQTVNRCCESAAGRPGRAHQRCTVRSRSELPSAGAFDRLLGSGLRSPGVARDRGRRWGTRLLVASCLLAMTCLFLYSYFERAAGPTVGAMNSGQPRAISDLAETRRHGGADHGRALNPPRTPEERYPTAIPVGLNFEIEPLAMRVWSSADGKSHQAAILTGIEDGTLRMRRSDGRNATISAARLSRADQQYVKMHRYHFAPRELVGTYWRCFRDQPNGSPLYDQHTFVRQGDRLYMFICRHGPGEPTDSVDRRDFFLDAASDHWKICEESVTEAKVASLQMVGDQMLLSGTEGDTVLWKDAPRRAREHLLQRGEARRQELAAENQQMLAERWNQDVFRSRVITSITVEQGEVTYEVNNAWFLFPVHQRKQFLRDSWDRFGLSNVHDTADRQVASSGQLGNPRIFD